MKFGKEYLSHLNDINAILTSLTSIIVVVSGIISIGIILLILKRKNKNFLQIFMFEKISIQNILLIIIQALGMTLICLCFITLTQNIFKSYGQVSEMISASQNSVLSIICYIIFIPVLEEILFRGIIFNELKKNINIVFSIVIQALIFALAHGNIAQAIYTFMLGILTSIVYIWTRSIKSNIVLHIGFNIFGTFFIPNIIYYNQNYMALFIILGIILVSSSLLILYKNTIYIEAKK